MRRVQRGSAPGPRCLAMSGLMPSRCLRFSSPAGFLGCDRTIGSNSGWTHRVQTFRVGPEISDPPNRNRNSSAVRILQVNATHLTYIDWLIMLVYFAFVLGIGFADRKSTRL